MRGTERDRETVRRRERDRECRSIIHLHTGVKGAVKQTSKTQADREQRQEHYKTYSYIGDDYTGIRYRDGNRGNLVRQGTHPREKQEKRGSEGMRKIREKI